MTKKSRLFLAFAGIAMVVSLVTQFIPGLESSGVRDFAVGLAAAFMLGVLITWKRSPQT